MLPHQPDGFIQMTPAELLGPLNEVEARHAPALLSLAGNLNVFDAGPRLAIVGSRDASAEALRDTTAIAKFLVEHGVTVVSGLARGIDTAAHTAAINAAGRTIAVLGTPLTTTSPASNMVLQHEIMQRHLAVSQFRPDLPVLRGNFAVRNRTMALLSHATLIVEAGEHSGSKHQGWEALRLGRPLFLHERIVSNTELTWPAEMLQYGAIVFSSESMEGLLEVLPATGGRIDTSLFS